MSCRTSVKIIAWWLKLYWLKSRSDHCSIIETSKTRMYIIRYFQKFVIAIFNISRSCATRVPMIQQRTAYPKKYAHGFVVLCFVVDMQSFIMNSHEVFIHIRQGCFAGTGAIVRLPQCQWSKPDGYGKISQCITTTKHSKAKTVCIFLGIYCTHMPNTFWERSITLTSYERVSQTTGNLTAGR